MSGRIPVISDARLEELVKRIRPVVRFYGGQYALIGERCYIKPVDPRRVSFLWNPVSEKRAKHLKKIRDITTYHTWGYAGFKASIAEVIAQIPEDLLDCVVAFEIIEYPQTAGDLNKHHQELDEGYYVAKTRLYAKRA